MDVLLVKAILVDIQPGLRLDLCPRENIARFKGLAPAPPAAMEMTIGHNVSSRAAVDQVMNQSRTAGARIVKESPDTFYGDYAGYFQDPDGHLWEIVWNPGFKAGEKQHTYV